MTPSARGGRRHAIDLGLVFAARTGGVVSTLLFIPAFDSLLDANTFGAISIILSLQALFLVFDLGFSTLFGADIGANRSNPAALSRIGVDLLRAEFILGGTALIVAGAAVLGAVGIANQSPWRALALALAVLLIGSQVLLNLAQASLNALGRYRINSAFLVAGTLARGGVAVLALKFIAPTILAFVGAQLAVSLVHLAVTRLIVHRSLPAPCSRETLPVLKAPALVDLCRRGGPLMLYTLAGAAVMQLDKPIVAAFYSLADAGRYFLATTFALTPIAVIGGPLYQYFFPKIAGAAQGSSSALVRLARIFQILTVCAVTAPTMVLVIYCPAWLAYWLPHTPHREEIAAIARILVAAGGIGATAYLPMALLLGAGERIFIAKLSTVLTCVTLMMAVVAGYTGDLRIFAGVYAAYHISVCLLLWVRIRRYFTAEDFHGLVAGSYVVPGLVIAGGSILICAGLSTFSSGPLIPFAASALCGLLSLVIALVWAARYEPRPFGKLKLH